MKPCSRCPYSAVCFSINYAYLHALLYRHRWSNGRVSYLKAVARIPQECTAWYWNNASKKEQNEQKETLYDNS